ncbi:hypothetical protein AX17_003368 [Amanita inopinata Kibby_2008]|nr:hypothetical protein AX17_003368 [Amanita inopinata Kibby_2008]
MTTHNTDLTSLPRYHLIPTEQLDMGKEEFYPKPEGRKGDTLAKNAAMIFLLASWIPIIINNPRSFGWSAPHPPLQSAALSLFTYGILTLQPTSQPKSKAAGLMRHQMVMWLLGIPFITFGTLSVWYNKALRGREHFVTWHGILGLLCIIWLIFQVFLGGGSVWFGGAAFGGGTKARALWKYHRLSGYIVFPLMLFTAHLGGVWSGWGATYTTPAVQLIAFTIAPIIMAVGVFMRTRLA